MTHTPIDIAAIISAFVVFLNYVIVIMLKILILKQNNLPRGKKRLKTHKKTY